MVSKKTRSTSVNKSRRRHEQKISDQLKAVIAAGQLAQSAAYAVWHQLHQNRIQRSLDLFKKNFALPWGAHVSLDQMMRDSTLAREITPLKTSFEFDRTHPIEFNLGRLRRLKQAFAELRTAAEAEASLVLQAPKAVPELTVVSAAA